MLESFHVVHVLCALQAVLSAPFCFRCCEHRHRFSFILTMNLSRLKGFTGLLSSFLFLPVSCSFAKKMGRESDHVLFLLSVLFSSLRGSEIYRVVHSSVTFPFIQYVQMNLTFKCLNQNPSKQMEKFLIPSVSGPHKLGLSLQVLAPFV